MGGIRKVQSGITFIGFIIVLMVLGSYAFVFMKLYPPYYEYYNVTTAMEALKREPGVARWTPKEILDSLEKRMYINYVDAKYVNRRSFVIKRSGTGWTVSLKYERREPIVYNLDYVAKFERTVVLGTNLGQQ